MKKTIITAIVFMTIYIACVLWIVEGVKLTPKLKFCICFGGFIPILVSLMVANTMEWLDS